MGIEPFLISSSLEFVLAQRLVRKLCPGCKEEYLPTDSEAKLIGELAAGRSIYRSSGCSKCFNTGYSGRTGIFEVMPVTDRLKLLINEKADGEKIKKAAREDGMEPLRTHGISKVLNGVTTIEEVFRVTSEQSETG
jgi:general secretion pathway protein E